METAIKKGAELELRVESLAFGGRGVCRLNGFVIFVEDALPGQKVQARIFRKRKGYAEARALQMLEPSSEEVLPRCAHFGECGGCRCQNLDYAAQLKYKQQQVTESLERIGGFQTVEVRPTLSSPDLYYYRNKMEFSFGDQRWLSHQEIERNAITKPRDFALGLHVRGRYDKILDLDECHLQSARSVELLHFVRRFALGSGWPPYTTRGHTGFWRHLVIREGKQTGETMVNLVTADVPQAFPAVEELGREIAANFPDVTTAVHNINRKKAQVAAGDEERVLFGPGYIKEKIGDGLFRISANSFFQTNTRAGEALYQQVRELGAFSGHETVYDLYAGAGIISIIIADQVKRVVGFELVEEAIADAVRNCELNGVTNCAFVQGDLKDALVPAEARRQWGPPDAMIFDPPRAGLHEKVLRAVLKLGPQRIVYVSCNPTTFARDVKGLCEGPYRLDVVQPVDMFPHTAHIEVVSRLTRA